MRVQSLDLDEDNLGLDDLHIRVDKDLLKADVPGTYGENRRRRPAAGAWLLSTLRFPAARRLRWPWSASRPGRVWSWRRRACSRTWRLNLPPRISSAGWTRNSRGHCSS